MIEFRHLRSFLAVADTLHFGRAAEQLHITQPPLTRQIQQLEELLDVELFDRSRRRIALTHAGEAFVVDARRLLEQLERAVDLTQRVARGESGRLRVGFISTADYSILPGLLKSFTNRYPGVDVDLLELTGDEQLRCLRDGSIDLGILIPTPTDGHGDLEWMQLVREPLVAVVPRSHRLARRAGALPVRALRGEHFVLFPRSLAPGLHDKILSYTEAAGFSAEIGQVARQMQTIIGLVAGGLGVSIVPACMQNLRRSDVVYKKLSPKPPRVDTMLAWRSPATGEVIESFLRVSRGFRRAGSRA